MASSKSPQLLLLLLFPAFLLNATASSQLSLGLEASQREIREGGAGKREEGAGVSRRVLMSFKETPRGSNVTFECSPSGPCLACQYSEKNNAKYRCSETGYRIPLKCLEVGGSPKKTNNRRTQKSRSALENTHYRVKPHVTVHHEEELSASIRHRSLLDDSSTSEAGTQSYITYRSCIPGANEEKLSVLGFEGIMLCLILISGSAMYFQRKRANGMSGAGAVRIPNNTRF